MIEDYQHEWEYDDGGMGYPGFHICIKCKKTPHQLEPDYEEKQARMYRAWK